MQTGFNTDKRDFKAAMFPTKDVIKIGESFKTAGKVETCGSDFVPEDIRPQNRDFVTNTL
jgi:hypothetical protein